MNLLLSLKTCSLVFLVSDPIKCTSGKTRDQINNWRGTTLKSQLLFIDPFLQVEIERCKLQANVISWVRFFSSNTVNNCCSLMHILVLLQANFLNINSKPTPSRLLR